MREVDDPEEACDLDEVADEEAAVEDTKAEEMGRKDAVGMGKGVWALGGDWRWVFAMLRWRRHAWFVVHHGRTHGHGCLNQNVVSKPRKAPMTTQVEVWPTLRCRCAILRRSRSPVERNSFAECDYLRSSRSHPGRMQVPRPLRPFHVTRCRCVRLICLLIPQACEAVLEFFIDNKAPQAAVDELRRIPVPHEVSLSWSSGLIMVHATSRRTRLPFFHFSSSPLIVCGLPAWLTRKLGHMNSLVLHPQLVPEA